MKPWEQREVSQLVVADGEGGAPRYFGWLYLFSIFYPSISEYFDGRLR